MTAAGRRATCECAASQSDQKDGALAASVGREEVDDIIVIKSQAACAQC